MARGISTGMLKIEAYCDFFSDCVSRLPSGYPNHIPTNKRELAMKRSAEENTVEGKTFQAYSIATMRSNLKNTGKRVLHARSGICWAYHA